MVHSPGQLVAVAAAVAAEAEAGLPQALLRRHLHVRRPLLLAAAVVVVLPLQEARKSPPS